MQEENDGRHEGATEVAASEAPRVLERADDVEVRRGGRLVAALVHLEEIGELKQQGGISWRRLRFRELRWSHGAALALMAGMDSWALFPPYLLTAGRLRPPYASQPGMDDVGLVEVLRNPEGLSPLELFTHIVKK
jgi:hypothetical protein